MGFWSNAFKIPEHPEPSADEKELILKAAEKIRAKEMDYIASLAVEASRPVHGLGAQALVFLQPFLMTVFGADKTKKFVELMENPKAVDFFLKSLNGDNKCPTKNSK